MKLLYILNVANRVNNFSYTSMLAAQNLGIEFHIAGNWEYKTDDERIEDEKKYGIHIHQIDFIRNPISPGNIKAYKQLDKLIKEWNFDAIHCNTPIGGLLGRIAGKKNKIKTIIYQAHGFHFYKGASLVNWILYYPVEKIVSKYTDVIITINKEDFEFSKKFKLKKNGKLFYVPGVGIDISEFSYINCNNKLTSDVDEKEKIVTLISIGELNKNKNNEVIIKAMEKTNNQNIHYFLCGVGDEETVLKNLSKQLNLDSKVHFLGFRKDVKELLKSADVFVLPSYREGLSRSLMEAMASGLPCVVSKIRGNVDLVEDNINGFLCNPDDVDAFAKAIDILAADEDLRNSIKKANLEKIKGFDTSVAENEMRKIYQEVFGL